jgi:hypothetical protein
MQIAAAFAGRECLEYWQKLLHHFGFAADHQAIADIAAGDATAGAHVEVMDAGLAKFGGAPDVVAVVGVAAVDEDVARAQQRAQPRDLAVDHSRGDHEPDGARRRQRGHQLLERRGTGDAGLRHRGHRRGIVVVTHAADAAVGETANHVAAHAAESDESQLAHRVVLCCGRPVYASPRP